MIKCQLSIDNNIDHLHKIISAEKFVSKRATITLSKSNNLSIIIEAKDPISMKAYVNSILNIINTYEKISNVK
jgi:tRNA threonylcarbamoyladenosine modification (KEOPS) complex  Pcc1 subunit